MNGIIEAAENKLNNNKTYITMIVAAVLGILQDQEIWTMPKAGWIIVGLVFGSSVRSAMKKMQKGDTQ